MSKKCLLCKKNLPRMRRAQSTAGLPRTMSVSEPGAAGLTVDVVCKNKILIFSVFQIIIELCLRYI